MPCRSRLWRDTLHSRATGASTESPVRPRHTRSVHASTSRPSSPVRAAVVADEPGRAPGHTAPPGRTARDCRGTQTRSARGPVAVSPTIAQRPRGVRPWRGVGSRSGWTMRSSVPVRCSRPRHRVRLDSAQSDRASTGAGSLPARAYRRRAVPSTCVATGTTIGIGATHILRSCSISNPAASIAAGVSRAVWQPPNALGQNMRSTKC